MGRSRRLNVCDNLGITYAPQRQALLTLVPPQFRREEDAERAVGELNNRWFNGQAVRAELSPVTDFRESCCRQDEYQGWKGPQEVSSPIPCSKHGQFPVRFLPP
uniref:RRM domain-containing protein n=1 Tax=Gopherus evgoodei TaxID=1825980 RepID=A0A8C4Y9L8_9SAUR